MKKLYLPMGMTVLVLAFLYNCLVSWSTKIDFSNDKCERVHYNIIGEELYRELCWTYEVRSLND